MGKIVSRLLAEALRNRKEGEKPGSLSWISVDMQRLVDLSDKEAVYTELDRDDR